MGTRLASDAASVHGPRWAWALAAVHRLDRLTSGVLVLARTKEAARQLQGQMMEGRTTKEYVCRVVGEFPRSAHAREPRWPARAC